VRVVFLTHNYPRHPGDVAGAFLHVLARALVAQGVAVRVVAPADGGETGPAELDGIPVRRVRYGRPERETLAYRGTLAGAVTRPARWRDLAALFGALRRAAREELARGADLVHAHWWLPAGVAAAGQGPGVVTLHGTDVALLDRLPPLRPLGRRVLRGALGVTAVSTDLATRAGRVAGLAPGAIRVEPMPALAPAGRAHGGGGAAVVARLTRQKRVDLVLRALAHPDLAARGVALTVVGDGPERPALERLAREVGLGARVRFVGEVPPAQVGQYLAAADVLLATGVREGFGLVAVEALALGVPVVACRDGGGLLDIVPDGGGGRLVEPSPPALAAAVLDLLGDAGAAAAALAAGERWRARLAPAEVARRYAAFYREALGAA